MGRWPPRWRYADREHRPKYCEESSQSCSGCDCLNECPDSKFPSLPISKLASALAWVRLPSISGLSLHLSKGPLCIQSRCHRLNCGVFECMDWRIETAFGKTCFCCLENKVIVSRPNSKFSSCPECHRSNWHSTIFLFQALAFHWSSAAYSLSSSMHSPSELSASSQTKSSQCSADLLKTHCKTARPNASNATVGTSRASLCSRLISSWSWLAQTKSETRVNCSFSYSSTLASGACSLRLDYPRWHAAWAWALKHQLACNF